MACCLMAPSHYLNQCWLIMSKVQRHSSEGNFTIDTSAINHWIYLENYLSKISFKSPRGQWVNRSNDPSQTTYITKISYQLASLRQYLSITSRHIETYSLSWLQVSPLLWSCEPASIGVLEGAAQENKVDNMIAGASTPCIIRTSWYKIIILIM